MRQRTTAEMRQLSKPKMVRPTAANHNPTQREATALEATPEVARRTMAETLDARAKVVVGNSSKF